MFAVSSGGFQSGLAGFTLVNLYGTAVVEITAGTLYIGRRHVACQDDAFPFRFDLWIGYRRGRKESLSIS